MNTLPLRFKVAGLSSVALGWSKVRKSLGLTVLVVGFLVSSTAYAAFYNGTDGDDDFTMDQGGVVAYLDSGNDIFHGAKEIPGGDHVYGGPGNDRIISYGHTDILRGRLGDDYLSAGSGRDGVYGWRGDDTLIGGGGADSFVPGPGRDTCVTKGRDLHVRRCEVIIHSD